MIAVIVAMAAALGAGPPAAAAAPAHAAAGSEKVCKKITYTGSRLGAVSVCKTRQEWNELQWQHDHLLRDQQQLDRALNDNG
jgi:hypothetical protein